MERKSPRGASAARRAPLKPCQSTASQDIRGLCQKGLRRDCPGSRSILWSPDSRENTKSAGMPRLEMGFQHPSGGARIQTGLATLQQHSRLKQLEFNKDKPKQPLWGRRAPVHKLCYMRLSGEAGALQEWTRGWSAAAGMSALRPSHKKANFARESSG